MYELRYVNRPKEKYSDGHSWTEKFKVLQYRIKRADPVYGVDIWTDWKDVPTVDEN